MARDPDRGMNKSMQTPRFVARSGRIRVIVAATSSRAIFMRLFA
jgi:hypothetical protein